MLKSRRFVISLFVLLILFCLYPNNSSIAGDCANKAGGVGTPTFSGNFNIPSNWSCPENPSLEYDTANSDETIERNGSAAIVVIGNNGPYTWSVSGTGFTLETENGPTGPTNVLYADGSACGAATITVTGCGGLSVTGYVRCTANSAWVLFCSAGYYESCYGQVPSESIIGDTKIRSITQCHSYPFENLTSSCGGYTCSYEGLSCVSACPYSNCNLRVYKWECQ